MYDPGNSLQFLQPELVGHFGRIQFLQKKLNNLSWFLLVLSEVITTHPTYSSRFPGEKNPRPPGGDRTSARPEQKVELNSTTSQASVMVIECYDRWGKQLTYTVCTCIRICVCIYLQCLICLLSFWYACMFAMFDMYAYLLKVWKGPHAGPPVQNSMQEELPCSLLSTT